MKRKKYFINVKETLRLIGKYSLEGSIVFNVNENKHFIVDDYKWREATAEEKSRLDIAPLMSSVQMDYVNLDPAIKVPKPVWTWMESLKQAEGN